MSGEFLPYGRQDIDGDDIEAAVEVLKSDWLTTGPAVDAFEAALADRCDAANAVAVNSGTSALQAAYRAAGVGPDTQVIVPALTFSATANAARQLGATVQFADICPQTLTVDPESVQKLVDETTAVIAPVDFAGHPASIDAIAGVADAVDATVVEDGAHSLGATIGGRPVGSVADMTIFSFHPVKAMTTGEGGAVVTGNRALAKSVRRLRNHGMVADRSPDGDEAQAPWHYDIDEIGWNYRITDMQCALGISQLRRLDDFIDRRRQIAAMYRERLSSVEGLTLPPEKDWCEHAYHLFVIRVPASRRRSIFDELRRRNIGVQVHYIPVNMLGAYRRLGHRPEETPETLRQYRRMISIPCFPKMTDDDVERTAQAVREVVGGGACE